MKALSKPALPCLNSDKGMEDKGFQDLKEFVPFSLFPPTYIHDIGFWITEHMSEQQFFQDI